LRHLEPVTDNENGTLTIVRCYDEISKTYYPAVKEWFETGEWKYELASKVIVSDELSLTDAEIAAHCLWELTYLGFDQSTEESWEKAQLSIISGTEADMSNLYNVAAEKLGYMLDINYLPKQFKDQDNHVEKIVNECLDVKPRTYGKPSKRMRHRIEKHIKAFERMAKVDDAIRRLTANTKSFTREELAYLFNTKLISECPYHSRSYNADQRIDYLMDLISNYESRDFSENTHFLLMFRTSPDCPLTQSEQDRSQNFFKQRLPSSANIRYGYGTDEHLDTEVSLLLLCSY
jgi:hypothetical protein